MYYQDVFCTAKYIENRIVPFIGHLPQGIPCHDEAQNFYMHCLNLYREKIPYKGCLMGGGALMDGDALSIVLRLYQRSDKHQSLEKHKWRIYRQNIDGVSCQNLR